MKRALSAALAFWLIGAVAAAAADDVKIEFHDGRVTLVAQAAQPAEILAAWSKAGQTEIVNGSRVTGAPMSIEFRNVPERTALETLLRSVSGFLAAARSTPAPGLSRFATVWVMATPVSPATATVAPPPPVPVPQPYPMVPIPGGPGLEGATPVPVPGREDNDMAPGSQMIRPMPVPPYPGAGGVATTPAGMFQPTQGSRVPGTIIAPPPQQPGQVPFNTQPLQPGQPLMPGQVVQPPQPGQPVQVMPPKPRGGGQD